MSKERVLGTPIKKYCSLWTNRDFNDENECIFYDRFAGRMLGLLKSFKKPIKPEALYMLNMIWDKRETVRVILNEEFKIKEEENIDDIIEEKCED